MRKNKDNLTWTGQIDDFLNRDLTTPKLPENLLKDKNRFLIGTIPFLDHTTPKAIENLDKKMNVDGCADG